MNQPQQIVDAARSWLGTAFAHQGRRKRLGVDKGGVDCLGLLVGVAAECELFRGNIALASVDEYDYGHFPDEKRLREALGRYLTPVHVSDIGVGDVLLMRIDGSARHLGLVGDYSVSEYSLIHAYAPARAVVEHRLDGEWMDKVVAGFRFEAL